MNDPYLSVTGLRKTFGSTVAVDHVDLELRKGEFLALLGPSGCGKTTLLRMLAGFERPDRGSIALDGRALVDGRKVLPPEKRRVGLVFQEYALFPHLSVEANVGFGVKSRRNRSRKVGEMLELVGLEGLGKRMPHELSGGQQQRVALARTLATEPELVLLDEPFSNLDPTLRARVRNEVWQILRDFNATAIVVTHDQEEAFSLPGVVGVMLQGKLMQVDTPAKLYQEPVNREVAEFVGDANFIPGLRKAGTVESQLGAITGSGLDGAVDIMVRPEDIVFDDASPVTGEVVACEFYGHDQVIRVRLPDGNIIRTRAMHAQDMRPGDSCGLRLRNAAKVYAAE